MAEINSLEELGAATGVFAEAAVVESEPVYEKKVDEHGRAYSTGKRKDAFASVWLKQGTCKITVKGEPKKLSVR
mgnify:CR=1 FL=1